MTGNHLGKLFRVTTFGESHGQAVGCIVEGCPPGLALDESIIQPFLDRRRPGQSHYTTQRRESDQIQILSGLFQGMTTGAPIAMMVMNEDARSRDYEEIKDLFRPGHADFTYQHKYGIRDWRGGGRASARETLARVAAGAIAELFLKQVVGIELFVYLKQMGAIILGEDDLAHIDDNPFFTADSSKIAQLTDLIQQVRREGDSIGALVHGCAHGVPIGLGEPVFDKLGASLAHAMMSIPAAKAFEIGDGMRVVTQKGSVHRDIISPDGFLSNHAGGMLGGISTGQDIHINVAFKPTSSIPQPVETTTKTGQPAIIATKGRHDPCVGIRAVPVVRAMMALVLMDHWLLMKTYEKN